MPSEDSCAERAKLATALGHCVSAVYDRRREYAAAKDRKEDTATLSVALQKARDAERDAERAYNDHINTHRCRN